MTSKEKTKDEQEYNCYDSKCMKKSLEYKKKKQPKRMKQTKTLRKGNFSTGNCRVVC